MVERPPNSLEAFTDLKPSADFPDFIIGTIDKSAGCEQAATFDRSAGGAKRFIPVDLNSCLPGVR